MDREPDMDRRAFVTGGLSSLALLSTAGCDAAPFTKMLYEPRHYDETALAFYVTEDGSRLVVVGEKYHYIFDDVSPSLGHILLSPLELRTVVAAGLTDFSVDSDNVVTGNYTLSLLDTASEGQRSSAIAAGFTVPDLTLSGQLKGQRYRAEGFRLPEADRRTFAHPYVVSVAEPRSMATKVLLTPLAVTADGVLIAAVVLILLPFALAK